MSHLSGIADICRCPHCLGDLEVDAAGPGLRCGKCEYHAKASRRGFADFLTELENDAGHCDGFGRLFRLREAGWFGNRKRLYSQSQEQEAEAFELIMGEHLRATDGRVLVDAGCGTGRLTANIARKYPGLMLVGCDAHGQLESLTRRYCSIPNLLFVRLDLTTPVLRSRVADFIWCDGVLSYTRAPRSAFASLASALSDGGVMYFWVYDTDAKTVVHRVASLFRGSHRYPRSIQLLMSYGLAMLILPFDIVRWCLRPGRTLPRVTERAFSLFDNLSQEHVWAFTRGEVRRWIEEEGLEEVPSHGSDHGFVVRKVGNGRQAS